MKNDPEALVMFHDGSCPLCQAEIVMLKHLSGGTTIRFVDVHDAAFESACGGVTREHALEVLHGRIGDGPLLQGVDVFAEAYQRAGFGSARWILTRRWLRPFLDFGYRFFAAHRSTISRLIGPVTLRLAERRYLRKRKQQPAASE